MLVGRCPLVRLVLAGAGPHRPDEIATYLDLPVAAVVPSDATGAAILAGRKRRAMGWSRRPLLAAARTFAMTYDGPTAAGDASGTSVTDESAPDVATPVEVTP
jgi:hypothetical protein